MLRTVWLLALGLLALLAVSAGPALAARVTLKGDVTYRERMALPPGATLSVRLVDLAAPKLAKVEAAAAIANPGQVPLTFTLNFDDRVIERGHFYALLAEISANGAVWFRNAEPFALDPLSPPRPLLVVTGFTGSTSAPAAPPGPPALPSILEITWQAETIAGLPSGKGINSTLSIAADLRAGGRGGCNSWFAQSHLEGSSLVFSAVAATRMACANAEATAQETRFFETLAATRAWRMHGDKLVLLDAAGAEAAVFGRGRF